MIGVAPPELLIASGYPSEPAALIGLEITLAGPMLAVVDRECKARGCDPAHLIAVILEAVLSDDLVGAVIDS